MSQTALHLTTLDARALRMLLERRPDLMDEPRPRDLRDLAERLDDPYSVVAALHAATLPCLQALQALQTLGGRARPGDLAALLETDGQSPAQHADAVTEALTWLEERAVVLHEDGCVLGSPALRQCMPDPLGLGPRVTDVLEAQTNPTLHGIARAFGLSPAGNKAALLAAVTGALRDGAAVRDVVSQAPDDVAAWLTRRALDASSSDDDAYDAYDAYDPVTYRIERDAVAWAAPRGLLIASGWGRDHQMPGEVALALRGPGYRAPFQALAPGVVTHRVGAAEVAREAAAAGSAFSAHAVAVLDHVARWGAATLKSGGVGARELTKLSKATGSTEQEVRLVLALAADCELLDMTSDAMVAAAPFARWREADSAVRLLELVCAWWDMGGFASDSRDEDGKALPALRNALDCQACAGGRHALLAQLAALEPGTATTVSAVGPAVAWAHPLVHAVSVGDAVPFSSSWAEAEVLGVVARGAASDLGRALARGDLAGAVAWAKSVLPATSDEAVFGADLTVVVTGDPSARVSALLDGCADRESRGGAITWRITPGSLRRALDAGTTGEGIEKDLADISRGALPQPLRYLVADMARKHGSVRVRPVACCLRSDDEPLLAQMAVDKQLKRLNLRVLAPTVLVSHLPAPDVVKALRGAGYLPMPEDAAGVVTLDVAGRPLPGDPRPSALPVQWSGTDTAGWQLGGGAAAGLSEAGVSALVAALVRAGIGSTGPTTRGT